MNRDEWVITGVGLALWALLLWSRWSDPKRPLIEAITGKPWWRNLFR